MTTIARRAGSGADATVVVAAARRSYDDLAVVLVPVISQAGVDALTARALQLAQREYPAADDERQESTAEPFGHVTLWLRRLDPPVAIDAAGAIFGKFAGLLASLIGDALTTRYFRKAWPDGFSETRPKRKRA